MKQKKIKEFFVAPKILNFRGKAQSISINTIVIAAIALTVMILIILITTGSIGNFRRSADDCGVNGGTCIDEADIDDLCGDPDYDIVRRDYNCYKGRDIDEDKVCCVST